jgi:hypothetical protein
VVVPPLARDADQQRKAVLGSLPVTVRLAARYSPKRVLALRAARAWGRWRNVRL